MRILQKIMHLELNGTSTHLKNDFAMLFLNG
jgi:hypothetical protein